MTALPIKTAYQGDTVYLDFELIEPSGAALDLDTADEIVIHCKSGYRSANALRELQSAGFGKLWNVEGGILAWADRIDSKLDRLIERSPAP